MVTCATPTTWLRQQNLKFEEDVELWQQLPEQQRHDVVCLLQQMLIQWCGRDSEGERS
jgi:hypothetical protein